ncbi:hypothetical protein [Sphingomonas humi]|uniref:Uncharacterized protein n=1 Tax=Sphingomonas humi TaxID=335630 RepID=A0ABP7RSR5_9SPHN
MISLLLALAVVQDAPANPIQAAAMSFSACVKSKVPAVAPALTPEAGADDVIKQCDAQRAGLETAVESAIAAAPPEQQAMAREQYKAGMARGRQGLIDGIKAMRAAPAK